MKTISLHTFKHTIRDIHKNTENRKFCFVIGAGASYKSGIPTGGQLATKWFGEIKERYSTEELNQWISEVRLNTNELAAHYGAIYRKRFESDKTSGYEFLVQAMRPAKPTFGHIVLAQILSKAPGNCILTTNFDSLIESSIYQYTDKTPLVCGHESLSGYARPSNIHPLIIKIHRDLLLAPKSDPDEINKLDEGWKEPLDNIFSSHIPIVIGYGGNDGSLMDYFEKMNKPSNFFWCGHKGSPPTDRVVKLVEQMDGRYIETDGFDEMMHELLWVFDEIKPIKEELNAITKSRIDAVNAQLKDLNTNVDFSEVDQKKELSAFEYSTLIDNEPDIEKRNDIYIEALGKFPKTGWLWGSYAYFLHFVKKDYKNLEGYYLTALAFDPENAITNGNYAIFLNDVKGDNENAEKYYLKALATDPENANTNVNYAVFLNDIKKDYVAAEKHYLKALTIDPEQRNANLNYAVFLKDVKGDFENAEKHYLKALAIDPESAIVIGNYAAFLSEIKKNCIAAEEYFLKALSIEPENDVLIGNYAAFLSETKQDHEKAEKYFLKALDINPEKIRSNVNYAIFLKEVKRDYVAAEKYYKIALSFDPENLDRNRDYATFLSEIKKDYQLAEQYFLKALAIDPKNIGLNEDYAIFLCDIKKDYTKSEECFRYALDIDPENLSVNHSYAIFLCLIKKDFNGAEKHLLKILSIDPENATYIGSYASFLEDIKKDYVNAEKYYQRALGIEPENATVNGSYAQFLFDINGDNLNAEKHFLRALDADPEDANINGNYALFLKDMKTDYENAEKHFLKALAVVPENADINGNYASLLLITNRVSEAEPYLEKAFLLNNNEKDGLLLELWFYKYAHFLDSIEESEKEIKSLLNEDVRSHGWNLDQNIEVAIKNGHPNPEKLKDFAKRISSEE